MGLRNFELYHRVFAHDASAGATGMRNVPMGDRDAATIVPANVLARLDELLQSLDPEGAMPAFAVQRFLIPPAIGSIACLAVCHPSRRDGMDRPALVTHARVVRVEAAEAWLDVDALIRLAGDFPGDVLQGPLEGAFTEYLDASEPSVELTGWDSTGFESVPRDFARDVIAACLSRWSRSEAVFHVEPRDSTPLLLDIAAAWSALPLYGQMNCPFSLHAQRGARVKALFSTVAPDSEVVSENLKRFAAEYTSWIHDRPDDVHFLTEDREIRELKGLEARFGEVKNAAPLVLVAGSTAGNPEGAMSRKKRQGGAERSAMRGGLDEAVVTAINADVKAAEESLRGLG